MPPFFIKNKKREGFPLLSSRRASVFVSGLIVDSVELVVDGLCKPESFGSAPTVRLFGQVEKFDVALDQLLALLGFGECGNRLDNRFLGNGLHRIFRLVDQQHNPVDRKLSIFLLQLLQTLQADLARILDEVPHAFDEGLVSLGLLESFDFLGYGLDRLQVLLELDGLHAERLLEVLLQHLNIPEFELGIRADEDRQILGFVEGPSDRVGQEPVLIGPQRFLVFLEELLLVQVAVHDSFDGLLRRNQRHEFVAAEFLVINCDVFMGKNDDVGICKGLLTALFNEFFELGLAEKQHLCTLL